MPALESRIHELEELLCDRDKVIVDRDRIIAEREKAIIGLQGTVQDQETKITGLQDMLTATAAGQQLAESVLKQAERHTERLLTTLLPAAPDT